MEHGLARGLDVDRFAPRLSFFWDVHNDFFEEIAKLRAARRIWARHMRERYGARDPRSWKMRFHCQTAGVTLTAQQPHNNVVRVAYQALAAVLGGTQSLHTNALDETLALPTEESVRIALRTQQILAYETGVPNVADPLGGSYYVEALTDGLEREAEGLFAEIEAQGGVVQAIESGWFQRQIAHSSMRFQAEVEQGRRTIVGVNDFVEEAEAPVEILKVGDAAEQTQRERHGPAPGRARRRRWSAQRLGGAAPRRRRGPQHHTRHAGLRACLLHAVRDPACARGDLWQLSRAGLLLTGSGRRHGERAGAGQWAGTERGRWRRRSAGAARSRARPTGAQPGAAPGGLLLPQARAARPEPRQVPHQAQEPGARRRCRRCRGSGWSARVARRGRARPRPGAAVPRDARPTCRHTQGIAIFACEGDRPVRGGAAAGGAPLPPRGGRARRWCASWRRSRTSSAGCSPWCSTGPAPGSSR